MRPPGESRETPWRGRLVGIGRPPGESLESMERAVSGADSLGELKAPTDLERRVKTAKGRHDPEGRRGYVER